MRLGIRRKLIGTLMLVGLFPLVMSLVVILGGGAAIKLREIREKYEDTAARCADQTNDVLVHEELEKLLLISRLSPVINFVRAHNGGPAATGPTPKPTEQDLAMDKAWPTLTETDLALAALLHNDVADRLRLLTDVDGHPRVTQVTNARGQVIAADAKTDDYFQADETWWTTAYHEGKGRVYISSITTATAARGILKVGDPVVILAVPIFDSADGSTVIGILEDELSVAWLLRSLQNNAISLPALTQLIDTDAHHTVFAWGEDGKNASGAATQRTEDFYFSHVGKVVTRWELLTTNLVVGAHPIDIAANLRGTYRGPLFDDVKAPNWTVVVSKPSEEAMTDVYRLAAVVAAIGVALILVLFILGVAISNREIIMPVLRLRQATSAVGRGEYNVRLISSDPVGSGPAGGATARGTDKTFRKDELGDLARDFDEMTRQLQKNINQLARSNEAKRRFMELAGHELRTPVAYLLGVCQLAQKQLKQMANVGMDTAPGHERTAGTAMKNMLTITTAFSKIAARTQRLNRIIDNLLKLVSNDQFTTRMEIEPVDMRAMILEVASDFRAFVAERKQQLIVDVADKLPTIEGDRDKLEDALTNLLSNAIRFSPDGGTIRLSAHEIIGDMIEILVEDSGPGIPAAELAGLFEPFSAGTDVMHHHSGEFEHGSKGLGLGLAIVRRFIELHGGIVRAHTIMKNGKPAGAQFQILLQVKKTEASAAAKPPVPNPAPFPKPR